MIKRILKIAGWTILSVIVIIMLAITIVVWYLTPAKLTPIVEREASAMLNGEFKASRVELTFWSSFPHVSITVDSLEITGNSSLTAPDSIKPLLPAYCDSLAHIDYLHGSINLSELLKGRIQLDDITIRKPVINLVNGPGGWSNYDIAKSSDSSHDRPSSTATSLPDLAIDRFTIADEGHITFTSIPDSLYMAVTINKIQLDGNRNEAYALTVDTDAHSPILENLNLIPLRLGLNAGIRWNPKYPGRIAINDLVFNLNEFSLSGDTRIDATDSLRIEHLDVSINRLSVGDMARHLPPSLRDKFSSLDTDMAIDLDIKLDKPYTLSDSLELPSATINLEIPDCHFDWETIYFNEVELSLVGTLDGDAPDRSTLNVSRLKIRGRAVDFNMNGKVTGPLANPLIDGHMKARLNIARLPEILLDKLPVIVDGELTANTNLRLRTSYLKPRNMHRIYLDGQISLKELQLLSRDSLLTVNTEGTQLDFGTSRTVMGTETKIDSMLTVSLSVDTAYIKIPGLEIEGSKLLAALGSDNRSTSADTTMINPFGGIIKAHSLFLTQPSDSMKVRLRDIDIKGTLKRYKDMGRNPLLTFDLNARRIGTQMPDFAMVISQPDISVNAHLTPPRSRGTRAMNDSLKARRRYMGNRIDTTQVENVVDWEISNDMKTLLRRWDINGSLKSNRAFVFMRNFPLRQRAADIYLTFNTDTVMLHNLSYSIGNTRFKADGAITNIERALTSRTGRQKLNMQLNIDAPYIDVNELSNVTFHESSGNAGPDPDYDEESTYIAVKNEIDTAATKPLIVPRNIEADISVAADSILYSDLVMHNFDGRVLIANSSVNLSELTASTEIGTASLTALYSAPDTAHMQFGMGLKLNQFHIDRMLTLIPAVDSLLPALSEFAGIINAELAATSSITPSMDFDLKSFKGAMKIDGDSLVLLDADTFKSLAKWLIFKNKKHNMIDHMTVEIVVDNNEVEIFPFIFDIDRYKLGVMGRNDLDMNLDYHVSVLKSPLPFKFGINIKGPLDDFKIRLGGAKIKPGSAISYSIADTTRINLLRQIEDIFKRGGDNPQSIRMNKLPSFNDKVIQDTTLSHTDSLLMKQAGYLPPDTVATDTVQPTTTKNKRNIFPWKKK
ncbi:MAG: AsmA family protein [Clostridiales bacterium]|nr:AsmA family protein [Clostridiales bacterium]